MNGTDLLAQFRKDRSEEAFGALVRRYADLVFSVAKRRLNNASLAEEAAQIVFINLAKTVPRLRTDAELAAWLHRAAINASISLWRSESRRRAREEKADVMPTTAAENYLWEELAPIVDQALNELSDAERQAILLRFFERRSMRELGASLGISEDAAKMRVSRALEHLRAGCGKRGVACAASVLAVLLTERAVEAASAATVISLSTLPIPAAVEVASTALRAKFLIGGAVVAGIAIFVALSPPKIFNILLPRNNESAHASASGVSITASADANSDFTHRIDLPDAAKMLRDAVRARERIHTGELQLDAFYSETTHPEFSNAVQMHVTFEDTRRRFESFGHGYAITNVDPDVQAQVRQMPRQEAIRNGLLIPFSSRDVSVFDGSALMEYHENSDEEFPSADVKSPTNDSIFFAFDPRCLGLSPYNGILDTIEGCLIPAPPETAKLIGEESVDGVSAWHVSLAHHSMQTDFWFDKAHPLRVLKIMLNGATVASEYDNINTNDVLPLKVNVTFPLTAGTASRRMTRQSARFGIAVDPASWTLAGLSMKIGTPVGDNRIHRMIGYWNGSGLSEFPPRQGETNAPSSDVVDWLGKLDGPPYAPETIDAAKQIIANTPDGPDVQRAAELIINNDATDTNLASLCQTLARVRPQFAPQLLQALLDQNPSIDVRGNACFALAQIRQSQADYGVNTNATMQAENLYQRVITEFSHVSYAGQNLAEIARPELDDLRRLSVGMPAPVTDGHDLDGNPLSLGDFLGRPAIIADWTDCCAPDAKGLFKIIDELGAKPFAVVGIYTGDNLEKARQIMTETRTKWPNFFDSRSGPIAQAWHINEWPVFQVIDAKGIIRARNVTLVDLRRSILTILKEDDSAAKPAL